MRANSHRLFKSKVWTRCKLSFNRPMFKFQNHMNLSVPMFKKLNRSIIDTSPRERMVNSSIWCKINNKNFRRELRVMSTTSRTLRSAFLTLRLSLKPIKPCFSDTRKFLRKKKLNLPFSRRKLELEPKLLTRLNSKNKSTKNWRPLLIDSFKRSPRLELRSSRRSLKRFRLRLRPPEEPVKWRPRMTRRSSDVPRKKLLKRPNKWISRKKIIKSTNCLTI